MSEDQPHFGPEKPEKRPLTAEEWRALKDDRDYEAIFRALGTDYQIYIERTRPTWCAGWCETIDYDPGDPIDLDYLRDEWGGQRFRLRLRDNLGRYLTDVHVKIDGEPKRHGKRIPHPEEIEHQRRAEERRLELEALRLQPAQNQSALDPTLGQLLVDSIKGLGASKDGQLDRLWDMMKEQMSREPEGRRDVKELLELAQSFRDLNDVFGGGEVSGDMWDKSISKMVDIWDRRSQLDERRKPPQQSQQQGGQKQIRIVKNLGSASESATTGAVDRSGAADRQSSIGSDSGPSAQGSGVQLSQVEIATTLANMESQDAADTFMLAMAKADPAKRMEVYHMLFGDDDEEDDDGDETEAQPETETA